MRCFDVMGRTTGLIANFFKLIGFRNIKSVDLFSSENRLNYHLKDGRIARIVLLRPGDNCVIWSVEDFKQKAIDKTNEDVWQDYYDESKFQEALDLMCAEHNAECGITWDTVLEYLEEYCQIKKVE